MHIRIIIKILAIAFISLLGILIYDVYADGPAMPFEGVWKELEDTATPTPTISSSTATATTTQPSLTTASTASRAQPKPLSSNTDNQAWSVPVNLSSNDGDSTSPHISYDNFGNVHVIWVDNSIYPYSNRVMHRMMTAEGVWTETVKSDTEIRGMYYAAVDAEGGTHVLANWINSRPVYLYKSLNEDSWSTPVHFGEMLSLGVTNDGFVVMDNGEVHVIVGIDYRWRDELGTWHVFEDAISYPEPFHYLDSYELKASPDGYLHMVFTGGEGGLSYNREVFHMRSKIGANWEDAQTTNVSDNPTWSDRPTLEIDSEGNPHVLYLDKSGPNTEDIYYRTQKNGVWSSPYQVTALGKSEINKFISAISPNGVLHLLEEELFYFEKDVTGNWNEIPTDFWGMSPQFSVSGKGTLHLNMSTGNTLIHYSKPLDSDMWTPTISSIIETGYGGSKAFTVTPDDTVLLSYMFQPYNGEYDIYFAYTYPIPKGLRLHLPVIVGE